MIEAVIFDCDGVLVDSEIISVAVEIQVLSEIGLHYEEQDFKHRFIGMSDKAFHAALDDDARKHLGRAVADEIVPQMRARKRTRMESELLAVPGALAAIRAVTHPKAVASSSTAIQLETKLKRVDLWDHVQPHVYSADHVEHAKPAPDLFLFSAKKLGVAPRACLVIEDSVNGVKAARAAGMRVWGFLGGRHMDEFSGARLLDAGAERVIADWPQFQVAIADEA